MENDHAPPAPEPPSHEPGSAIEVEIHDDQSHLTLDHAALGDLIRRALRAEGVAAASISLAIVDDAAIHAVNRKHLAHDWPTDVITFPLGEPGDPDLAGELVVSAEMALTTAREAGADPFAELALYVVHGLLHLCGHDDLTEADAAAMRAREDEVLRGLGLVNTFALIGATDSESNSAADEDREASCWPR